VEVSIGRITLIAESRRWCSLRDVVGRLIGWSAERRAEVDRAMRTLRMAAMRRGTLLLCGDGDLVSVARLLHRHALGADRPLILRDPRPGTTEANGFHATNVSDGAQALVAAAGGTLCVWLRRVPTRFAEVATAVRHPDSRVQLTVCVRA